MRQRIATLLVVTAAATAAGLFTAPSASACTGLPCDLICAVHANVSSRGCPIE